MTEPVKVRIDKWLWAARFFKTRRLATEAIKGGRVHINGARVKPGKAAEVGQLVHVNKAAQHLEVEIIALSDQRGSYPIAQTLYQETPASIDRREHEKTLKQLARQATPQRHNKGRPTKRDRRQIIRFTEQ